MKIQPLLERVAQTIKLYVDRRVGELDAVLKAMPTPKDGKDGRDGSTPTVEELKSIIQPLIPTPVVGEKGERGADGKDGSSVSIDDVRPLVEEVVKSIPVPKDGRDGADGRSVSLEDVKPLIEQAVKSIPIPLPKDGRDGIDGKTPTVDEIKSLIPAPLPGDRGADGKDGRDGKNGTDGRDALDIAPIPMIDEAKSYPRGTYATHLGGFWRSFEQTKGMKGWECLVNGFNGFEEEQIDERTTLVRCFTSTGTIETTRKSSHMFYRELWKNALSYEKGDVVTWGGNMWVAIKHDGDYKQPGTEGSGWRLAVRAGRDGDRS